MARPQHICKSQTLTCPEAISHTHSRSTPGCQTVQWAYICKFSSTVVKDISIERVWVQYGLTSHSTHFRSFQRRWSDCGISQDCSRSQSPQSVRCWVVCARPLLITVVCIVYYLKGIVSVCLDARLGLRVSLEHAFTCVSTTNQAERRSSATHLLARWEHESTTGIVAYSVV